MAGWHHRFSGHELGQTPGDGEEQGPGVMGSRRVGHNLATEQHSIPFFVYVTPLLIHSSVDGRLGCFLILLMFSH